MATQAQKMMLHRHGVTRRPLAAQPLENTNLEFLILQTQPETYATR